MNNLDYKWVVYILPQSSPGDYYNTIEDIVGIFNSKKSATDFCNKFSGFLKIKRILVEE